MSSLTCKLFIGMKDVMNILYLHRALNKVTQSANQHQQRKL